MSTTHTGHRAACLPCAWVGAWTPYLPMAAADGLEHDRSPEHLARVAELEELTRFGEVAP